MKIFNLFLALSLFCSCSSLKKSKRYGGIFGTFAGAVIGGLVGKSLSPNEPSEKGNVALGAVVGSAIGYFSGRRLGKSYYDEDPENFQGPDIQLDKKTINNKGMIRLEDIGAGAPPISINQNETKKEVFKVSDAKELPEELKGVAKKQFVIKHHVPRRKVKTKDNRYFVTEDFKMYEIFFADGRAKEVKNEKKQK